MTTTQRRAETLRRVRHLVRTLPHITRDGDNAAFVCGTVLPMYGDLLSARTVQVIRWAYGLDGEPESYEATSDGETVAFDILGPGIKSPLGNGHDRIYAWHRQQRSDPERHVWTLWEANAWLRRGWIEFGMSRRQAWAQWLIMAGPSAAIWYPGGRWARMVRGWRAWRSRFRPVAG